jgi:biotin carboxyl carrier protein
MNTDATSPVTSATEATAPPTGVRRRWLYAVLILAFLFVLMPFLFWQSTWFGKPLNDAQIGKYFADTAHPRKAQHALSQISDRMASPDPAVRESAKRWYPQVVAMAGSSQDELRVTAAWVMGQDNTIPEFHQVLLRMLPDANPMVERNAALSLVRFQDSSGHNIIVQMLQPYALTAPATGKLSQRLKVGDILNPGTMVAHIEQGSVRTELRSKVPGTIELWLVADGSAITPGQPLLQLSPSPEVAWEALRALFLIGTRDDLPVIDAYMRGSANLPPNIVQQASLTRDSIRARNP